jgi:hypothetical protein
VVCGYLHLPALDRMDRAAEDEHVLIAIDEKKVTV